MSIPWLGTAFEARLLLNFLAGAADVVAMNSEKTSKWKMAQASLETVNKHSTLWEGIDAASAGAR